MKILNNVAGWAAGMMSSVLMVSMTATAQDAPKVTDPEIGHIVVTANQIDVNYSKIALKKSKDTQVKHFAETMIKDHESLIKTTQELAKKLNVTPKDNGISQSLVKGEKQTTVKLNGLKGASFNKAYIDNEVSYHEAVISTLKRVLIPQAKNKDLKNTLVSVMPLLEHHLEMAKMAQSKIK